MGFCLLKKSFFAAGLAFTISLCYACSQENLIFYPETLPAGFRFNFKTPFEEVVLPVDGGAIHALLFKTERPRGVVLYFHGNAGSLRTWGEIAPEFTSRGYDILIPDYRGFGKSTGQLRDEAMLLQDGMAAYAHLARHYPADRIVVYGRSIGTGIAAYIARAERPGMLMLESPYFNLIDLAVHHYPYVPALAMKAFLKYHLRTDLWIPQVQCPIYIFHGTRDSIIPFDASLRLMKVLANRGQLIRIEEGGHNDLSDHASYRKHLSAILQQRPF